ncbi:hypothetical protein ACFQS6_18635 [Xanthomonas populi]|uniref:Uncharacterized protein n=1 Tax=Xanthomonas populi TaxID=53414 RepID=A0A2S7ERI7_9XANT|nr:hypothetical protein [Xanthomonas populi]PPU95722.1 hypothetical protein XpopCFBP1817_08125 [Xanthomonas populi]
MLEAASIAAIKLSQQSAYLKWLTKPLEHCLDGGNGLATLALFDGWRDVGMAVTLQLERI